MPLHLHFKPDDTLFFRDSRPFEAGNDTLAETVLPSPLTIFGVIGDYYLEQRGISLAEFKRNGDEKLGKHDPDLKKPKTRMKIKGPFFESADKLYFPPPANLWVSGNGSRLHALQPKVTAPIWDIEDGELRPLDIPLFENRYSSQPEPLENLLSLEGTQLYLAGKDILPSRFTLPESSFFEREVRFGHTVNKNTGTVEEGFLYSTTHLRFTESLSDKARLLAVVDGLEINDFVEGPAAVGGERRTARLEVSVGSSKFVPEDDEVLEKIIAGKRFFLYFITPTIFSAGWKRGWPPEFSGSTLVGAAINKPDYISGWQKSGKGMEGNPRALMKTVPAGSVYFFEATNWGEVDFENLYREFHCGESLSEYYPCAGFGTTLIGVW